MSAILEILLTIIFYTIVMFLVNRSLLSTHSKKDVKNSEANVFMKQIIGLELIVLIIILTFLLIEGM